MKRRHAIYPCGVFSFWRRLSRTGAIIPSREAQNYFDEKPLAQLRLDVYPHEKSTRQSYEDDGRTFNYQNGDFCETQFESVANAQQVDFDIGERKGKFVPAQREFLVRIHGQAKAPKAVLVNQK